MSTFFISHRHSDVDKATWVKAQLELMGHATIMYEIDFKVGNNFMYMMMLAEEYSDHTVCIMTEDFLDSEYGVQEISIAMAQDPLGIHSKLIIVLFEDLELPNSLQVIINIDLRYLDLDSEEAENRFGIAISALPESEKGIVLPGSYEEITPKEAAVELVNKGIACHGHSELKHEAKQYFYQAIELDPTNAEAYYQLAQIEDYPLTEYKKALLLGHPEQLRIHSAICYYHYSNLSWKHDPDFTAAILDCNAAIAVYEGQRHEVPTFIYHLLFVYYSRQEEVSIALGYLTRMINQTSDTEPVHLHLYSDTYSGRQIDDKVAMLLVRAYMFHQLNQLEEAVADYTLALELELPEADRRETILSKRARLYYELGEEYYPKALADLKAIKIPIRSDRDLLEELQKQLNTVSRFFKRFRS